MVGYKRLLHHSLFASIKLEDRNNVFMYPRQVMLPFRSLIKGIKLQVVTEFGSLYIMARSR